MNRQPGDDEDTGVRHMTQLRASHTALQEVAASLRDRIHRALEASTRDVPAVLIVDDEPVVRDTFRRMLRGAEIVEAPSIAEAVAALSVKPDLILLDLELLDGNGFEVAAVARLRGHMCPIIVVSAYIDEAAVRSFSRLPGPIEFAGKDQLVAVVSKAREHLKTPRGTPQSGG